MSTHPAYDPDPQVDGPTGARGVRCLVDEIVRAAAPRLGKIAVARIAGPLTEGVIALRDELRAELTDVPSGRLLENLAPGTWVVRSDGYGQLVGLPIPTRIEDVDQDANVFWKPIGREHDWTPTVSVAREGEFVSASDALDARRIPVGSIVAEQRSPAPERIGTRTGTGQIGFQWTGEDGYRTPKAVVRMISVGGIS